MKDKYVSPRGQAPGMELRDWFAGMAMQGLLARFGIDVPVADIASAAFTMADAMEEFGHLSLEEICESMVEKTEKDQEND